MRFLLKSGKSQEAIIFKSRSDITSKCFVKFDFLEEVVIQ